MENRFNIQPPTTLPSAKVDGCGKAALLSAADAQRLFEGGFVRDRDRLIYAICYFCGCRISESLQLRVEDVDLKGRLITFPGRILKGRGHPSRQVEIPEILVEYFGLYDGPKSGYLFRAHAKATKQEYLGVPQAHRILKAACARVGLTGVSTHSFRRSYISALWQQGVSPYQLRAITGHKSMTSLMEYLER